ncbi:Bro-N domain-containing protein [Aeromonas veronii]
MDLSLLVLSYETEQGRNKIKTINRDAEVLFSLPDVVRILIAENRLHSTAEVNVGFDGFYRAQIEALEPDEQQIIQSESTLDDPGHELYVTQPGLLRLLSRDKSPACKRFQRWVFHEVIPSIIKFGNYPPPSQAESDLMRLAKLMVSEIAAREKLERETKAQLAEHSARISHLSNEVTLIKESSSDFARFAHIDEFCEGMDDATKYYVFCMCDKVCLEGHIETKKISSDGGFVNKLFPREIIISVLNRE